MAIIDNNPNTEEPGNKGFSKTLIICASIFLAVALYTLIVSHEDGGPMLGLTALIFSVIYLFIGIIFVIFPSTRPHGKAMLLLSGIMFVIGFAVCTASISGL